VKHVYKILKTEKILPSGWGNVDVRGAAGAGHLSCVQYLLEVGLPPSFNLCTSAAKQDQLQVLKVILMRLESKLQYSALCELWGAAAKG